MVVFFHPGIPWPFVARSPNPNIPWVSESLLEYQKLKFSRQVISKWIPMKASFPISKTEMHVYINQYFWEKDKLPTKMVNFNFFKLCRKTEDEDRDHRTARTETDYRPPWNGHDLVAVRIPISKSFKVYEHSQLTANIAPTTISPTKTSFYKDDIAWWSYFCLGFWCNSCAGLLLNFKLNKNISKVFNLVMINQNAAF